MHRIESRTYVGQPGETVIVATEATGGGQASVFVNGVDMGPQARFELPPNAGDQITWHVALSGPLGASCAVDLRIVDGGSDGDFLVCQTHNPAPVHFYTSSVAAAAAMRGARRARAAGVRKTRKGKRKAAKAPTRKSAKRATGVTAAKKKTVKKKTVKKKTVKKKKSGRKASKTRSTKRGRS